LIGQLNKVDLSF